ncbi:MAG: superoxide dismutase [Deltaproteobacteria bacterium]|nr:superoxide dismutase [Deltaproteobacteria bacterium]
MKKIHAQILIICCIICIFSVNAFSHCEIPCGIYDDEMRIEMINEHIVTIEKSMNQIMHLQMDGLQNSNQLIRWIMNKEDHADEIQEIISQYFMTQRITPDMKDYGKKLGLLHEMLISAMKCKQTTDLTHVGKLRDFVKEFQRLYFEKE